MDRFFREDETIAPRLVVGLGLLAIVLVFLAPHIGGLTSLLLYVIALLALVPLTYSVLRILLPLMDPRDPDADRFAVWGGLALCVLVGLGAFGLVILPAFAAGGALIWTRAPELFEPFEAFGGDRVED